MKKLLATIALALMAGAITYAQNVAPGISAILAENPSVKFVEATGTTNGQTMFWRFMAQNPFSKEIVVVTVPSYCTPKAFIAHMTIAFDAVRFHKQMLAGQGLPQGEPVQYPPANLSAIIAAIPGMQFLGQVSNRDSSNLRWLFYFPAQNGAPAVVINVTPKIESVDRMVTAYWTAVDAVRSYDQFGDGSSPKAEPKVKYQLLNNDGSVPTVNL